MKMFRAATACLMFSALSVAAASAAPRFDVIHSFAGPSGGGSFPAAALMRAADGNYYGTTEDGGAFDRGTIFKMTPTGVVTILYSFSGGADGNAPRAALIQANDGNFFHNR